MKKLVINTEFSVFEDADQLSESLRELLKKAHQAIVDSYSPYSNFKVGAAVLLDSGEIILGSNQENAAYSVCLCAERVALASVSSNYPDASVLAIAVTAKSQRITLDKPISPCGTCRQYICEVESKNQQTIQVIMQGETGPIYYVESARDLLPLSFDASFL